MKKLLILLSCVASFASAAEFDFYERGPYRTNIPQPESVRQYATGSRQSTYAEVLAVVQQIASAARDRVQLIPNGSTWEGRQLYLAVVSSPENLARLESVRADLARLADPRTASPAEAADIAARTPVVVWLNYGIHGNESASYEAVQHVLYQLAASEEPETLEILRNVVTVINVMHNPDGHERFAVWENSVATGDPEPFSIEHMEPYQIHGRGNHYRFDMNRDMLALTQPENVALAHAMRAWHPQVFVDHHGQVATYFFPPAAEPINRNLPLERTRLWYDRFGRGNAAAFDEEGWQYYVRQVFDVYYAGYLDSWASLNGATGMTYETDAGGPRSLRWRRDDGTILTFREGIAKHFTASLATLATASRFREERLRDYHAFFRTGMAEVGSERMKRVVLVPGEDPVPALTLVRTLLHQGAEVHLAREAFRSSRAHSYSTRQVKERTFPAGSYVIDLRQPQKRLLKAQLEIEHELDPAFTRAELERRARNEARGKNVPKEQHEFYDITVWSLPLAFGTDAWWTEDETPIRGLRLELTDVYPAGAGDVIRDPLAAARARALPLSPGSVRGGRARTAYLIPPAGLYSAKLALALLAEEFRLSVSTRPLTANGRQWPAGTLVLRVDRNRESLHERIAALAADSGAGVVAVQSAYADEGATGVGSNAVTAMTRPKIAVFWDEAVAPTSYGSTWYLLERELAVPFTPINLRALRTADLSTFNVLILPDGSAANYRSQLGKDEREQLKAWVTRGGTIIAFGAAAVALARSDVEFTTSRIIGADAESAKGDKEAKDPPAEEEKKQDRPVALPGSAFRVTLDRNHYLTYGTSDEPLVVLMSGGNFFTPSKEGANVATFARPGELLAGGFVWPDNTERLLSGSGYLIDEPTGRGHLILFAHDPIFRQLWTSSRPLLVNAIMFSPTL